MTPKLPYSFKPSKQEIFTMVVTKITSYLNHTLTLKQVKHLHALIIINGLNHLDPMVITQLTSPRSDRLRSSVRYSYLRSVVRYSKHVNEGARASVVQFLYQKGLFRKALGEYLCMRGAGVVPCGFVVACAVKACMRLRDRVSGVRLHGQVCGFGMCGDVHVGTALVGFYMRFDDVENAKKVYDEMADRNVASCLINRYLELGNLRMAERVFLEMGSEDVDAWDLMVSWYTRSGDMEKAIDMFGPMAVKTLSTWSAMIAGYVDSGSMEIARNFYDVMPEQNVGACIKMIDGYSDNGDVESARKIFDGMDEKDRFLYNAMISSYAQNGLLNDALQLFNEMLQPYVNIRPDNMTLATIVYICSESGNLIYGSWIHETLMNQMRIEMDDHVSVALIELYAKCGRLDKAYGLFHGLQKKHVDVYTTLILACSRNGWKHDAIKLFEEMLEANICPNLVTFSGLLTALNHVDDKVHKVAMDSGMVTH